MYSETPGHIKTKKLKMRLKLPLYQVAGILEMLWNLAATCAEDGGVGRYSNEEIAAHLEYEGDHDELIAALIHCRWLDEDSEHRLVVHDWEVWRPHYIDERIRKRQERKRRLDCPDNPRTRPAKTPQNEGRDQKSTDASGENSDRQQSINKSMKKERSIDGAELTGNGIDELKPAVDELFRKTGYRGDQGTVFWKAAYLVRAGKIPFDIVEAVARRTKDNANGNPPAFFRKTLVNACKDKGINAEDLLGSVSMPKRQHRGPPKRGNGSLKLVNELAAALSSTEDS